MKAEDTETLLVEALRRAGVDVKRDRGSFIVEGPEAWTVAEMFAEQAAIRIDEPSFHPADDPPVPQVVDRLSDGDLLLYESWLTSDFSPFQFGVAGQPLFGSEEAEPVVLSFTRQFSFGRADGHQCAMKRLRVEIEVPLFDDIGADPPLDWFCGGPSELTREEHERWVAEHSVFHVPPNPWPAAREWWAQAERDERLTRCRTMTPVRATFDYDQI